MAALVPLATIAVAGLQVAQAVTAQRQQRQQYRIDYPVQQQAYEVQRQQVAIDRQELDVQQDRQRTVAYEDMTDLVREQDQSDRRRREALRRAVARQRARLGARGIDASAASGEALLLGLVNESALQAADEHADTRSRYESVQRDLDHKQRVNLLDRGRVANEDRLAALSQQRHAATRPRTSFDTAGAALSAARTLGSGLHSLL